MNSGDARTIKLEDVFTRSALVSYGEAGPYRRSGRLVHLAPGWIRWAFWGLPIIIVVTVGLASVVKVTEYADGPALVRAQQGVHVVARSAGTVLAVLVTPGQRVKAGQVILQLSDEEERQELARLQREWELNLVAVLRDPPDAGSREGLIALRAQREKAEERLREREIRSSGDAIIGDVWSQAGQQVKPGDRLVSVLQSESPPSLILALPGHALPFLKAGAPFRLELEGFAEERQDLVISTLSEEIVGPTEARRYLGNEQAEPLPLQGPVALATVTLPSRTFSFDGRQYQYRAGLMGRVYVPLRTQTILELLFPFLRELRKGLS